MHKTPSQADIVDDLAEEFIARYRNGERPSLSEFAARCPERADEIRELFPALIALEQAAQPGTIDSYTAAPGPEPLAVHQLGDFRIIREVGRGGMGVVYEAEQVSLGRRVALKVLPKQVLLDSRHAKRFEREARAAAKLHHTNIVPVFGVGQQDGLHYYVMQFIHGLGLDEVLVELQRLRVEGQESRVKGQAAVVGVQASACAVVGVQASVCDRQPEGWTPTHNDVSAVGVAQSLLSGRFDRTLLVEESDQPSAVSDQPTTSAESKIQNRKSKITSPSTTIAHLSDTIPLPGQSEQTSKAHSRSVYWQSVARIGVQAAEALQYAHDQGVIHRDVKPGNLLLDTRGCVWVTDFGLAKATDQQDLTHTGDVLGTLRYMAPEQFDGQADARSDVYSLGLTLYELLALQPAFDETERHKLVKQVTTGMPTRLRTLDRHIPRDLETIVHKAIEREPGQRYATAGELAADLQRYLQDEPIHARRPAVLQRLVKWTRRHRSIVVTAALGLLGAMSVLAGSLGWIARDRAAQRQIADAEVIQALRDAENWIDQDNFPNAAGALRRAEGVLAGGFVRRELDQQVRGLLADLRVAERVEEVRIDMSATDVDSSRFAEVEQLPKFGAILSELGVEPFVTPPHEAAGRLRRRSRIVQTALVGALDQWAGMPGPASGTIWLLDVVSLLDPDPWRNEVRQGIRAGNVELLMTLAENEFDASHPPASLIALASYLYARGQHDAARRLLLRCQHEYPADFWTSQNLCIICSAMSWRGAPYWQEAVRFGQAAVALRPDSAGAHLNLGHALEEDGQLDAAAREFERALALRPDYATAITNLGRIFEKRGRLDDAEREYRRATEVNPKYPAGWAQLGTVLVQLERLPEAADALRQALDLNPTNAKLACNLGFCLKKQGKLDEAGDWYQRATELDPEGVTEHNGLGLVRWLQRRISEARLAYQRVTELDPMWAEGHFMLGQCLWKERQFDAAAQAFERTTQRDPHHYEAHLQLGICLQSLDRLDEASTAFRRAIDLVPDRPQAHNNLGGVLARQEKWAEAEESFRRAIALDETMALPHYNLAMCLVRQERLDEAIDEFRRMIELSQDKGDLVDAHNELGVVLQRQEKWTESEEAYRRAIAIDENVAKSHHNLGSCLFRQERLEEALGEFQRARDLDPDDLKFRTACEKLRALLHEGKQE